MEREQVIIISMLGIVILLLVLIKFPIQINITQTDCPEVQCRDVECKCLIEVRNESDCPTFKFDNGWEDYDWIYYTKVIK